MAGLQDFQRRFFAADVSRPTAPPELDAFMRDLARYFDWEREQITNAAGALIQVTNVGTITISAGATTGTYTFPAWAVEPDTTYYVTVTPITVTGGAAAGASRVRSVAKTVTAVTITVEAAPGGAEIVTFDVAVHREPRP